MRTTAIDQLSATLEHTMSAIRADADTTAPQLVKLVSPDGSPLPPDGSIVLEFSEVVFAGAGRIELIDVYHQDARIEIDIDDPSVSISGKTLTWTVAGGLALGGIFAVKLGSGTIKDAAGNTLAECRSQYFDVELSATSVDLTGGPNRDVLHGSDLADLLNGGTGGADLIFGHDGNDFMAGGDEPGNYSGDRLYGGEGDDTIHGNGGHDWIEGESGNDLLYGGADNDQLFGEEGDDLLDGGDGNDHLHDRSGVSDMRGGDGDDSLDGGSPGHSGRLDGGAGDDFIIGIKGDTVIGGPGNDNIWLGGTTPAAGPGAITGGDGDDTFSIAFVADAGFVPILGGAGRDTYIQLQYYYGIDAYYVVGDFEPGLNGDRIDVFDLFREFGVNPFAPSGKLRFVQDGADAVLEMRDTPASVFVPRLRLAGVNVDDITHNNIVGGHDPKGSMVGLSLAGSSAGDVLEGTSLDDSIQGLGGSDTIRGNLGNDHIEGGDEIGTGDALYGDEGNDIIAGGDGDDFIDGGTGQNLLDGGAGNDHLIDEGGDSKLLGGEGSDVLQLEGRYKGTADGGAGNDVLSGGHGRDTLIGGAGDDEIRVTAWLPGWFELIYTVQVDAGEGDDIVIVQAHNGPNAAISVRGGAGNDLFAFPTLFTSARVYVQDFQTGDRIDLTGILPVDATGNPFGSSGWLVARQDDSDTVIYFDRDGAAGGLYAPVPAIVLRDIEMSSLSPADFVGGYDPGRPPPGIELSGTAGNDILTGTPYRDRITGGNGADTISGGDSNDYLEGGEETPGDAGDAVSAGRGDDELWGGAGDDFLQGDEGDDLLTGGSGDDTLEGGAGHDVLIGGDGNDILVDGEGVDKLSGGAGNDQLRAVSGQDTLDGGSGDDQITLANTNLGSRVTVLGGDGADTVIVPADATYFMYGVMASGGAGRDTYRLGSKYDTPQFTITDFAPGSDGDMLDLTGLFALVPGYSGGNPLKQAGLVRLVQNGSDTQVQFDQDGVGGAHGFVTAATLAGVTAASITSANFTGTLPAPPPAPPPPRPSPVPPSPPPAPNPVPPGQPGTLVSGGEASDLVAGTQFNDTLLGMGGNDRMSGGAGDDFLDGGNDNDELAGGAGNDKLAGGSGTDTATFVGSRSNFTITRTESGTSVKDATGVEGEDILSDVERAIFGGHHFALDIDGAGGQTYRIYQAAFNRTPDHGGVGYWLAAMDGGTKLADVAGWFMKSPEFIDLYGAAPTNEELAARIYENVLHRKPDAGGTAFWLDVLNSGRATAAEVLAGFSESDENKAALVGVISNGVEYVPHLG